MLRTLLPWATLLVPAAAVSVAVANAAPSGGTPAPDFNRDVRPILARHCLKCHGPDDKQRHAGLRLDLPVNAQKGGAGTARAIVPGKPAASELVRRILAKSPDSVMPPPVTQNPLTDADKQILQRWIAAGAKYEQHWAFVPPKAPKVPKVRLKSWPRNPIDNFVLARLEAEGLKPSPPADRYTLARRVYLDLIGLPPTPEEADAFVQDRAPDAYEKLVDRLLASPRYGERWARRWLDLARYADTNGYEKDRGRNIWPYRDWVINALNADMPFNQFTVEQIAGDMLPKATVPQRVATGFHRNTMLNEEGGIDALEYRFLAMTDRVAVTGTTWLGLTVGCAQCHTHKYDPIPQREYYQFMAFLDNTDEPELDVPSPELAQKRADLEKQVAALEADLPNRFPAKDGGSPKEALDHSFSTWLAGEEAQAVKWTPLKPTGAKSNLPLLTIHDDATVVSTGDQTKRDVYDLTFHTELKGITALRLEALTDDSMPKHGPGRVYYEGPFGDFFLSEITASATGAPLPWKGASQTFGTAAAGATDGNPQTGWSINGGQGKPHSAVFNLAQPLNAGDFALRLLFERYYAAGMGRFRVSVTTDPRAAARLPADVEDALAAPAAQRTAAQRERLLRHYLSVAPELAPQREAIRVLREQLPAYPTTLVMTERPAENPRPTFVHRRGEFLQPQEQVQPAVFSVLNPLPPQAPRNRLGFAEWLVDPKNPLVGRVTVNRQWAAFFGQGIVRTTEDFGTQGAPPTHPELLDWLAVAFESQDPGYRASGRGGNTERASGKPGAGSELHPNPYPLTPKLGWSLKALHRLIVTSATYQQSSATTPELEQKDPQNRLLTRGPRFRMEAELLRDSALRASGLLTDKLGGPSVFPPQPANVTMEGTYGGIAWKAAEGPDRYRRGLYTYSKRTAPYAMFNTFDAPSGEACVARREVSNTPLQALTLLNDPVFIETAQALGKMIAARPGTPEERAAYLFRRCLTRVPTAEELSLVTQFYTSQKQRLEAKELNAATLAGPGDGDPTERAAWTLVARSVMNLDEAIVKR